MNLEEYLNRAQKSLFRFEYLQEFNIPSEQEEIEFWRQTGKIDKDSMKEWWDFIESKAKNGVKMQRVRLVTFPLTEYTKFELDIFRETIKHRDEIKIITQDKFGELAIDLKDFWLVDDRIVLDMNYDQSGRYEGFEIKENIEPYIQVKNLLLQHSLPLESFLAS